MNRKPNRIYVYTAAAVLLVQITGLCGCRVSVNKKEEKPKEPEINVINMIDETEVPAEEDTDAGFGDLEDVVEADTGDTGAEQDVSADTDDTALQATTEVVLDPGWKYAERSMINSGSAVLYNAMSGRKNIVVAVNAGHGTKGGQSVKTYCHPDKTPKVTGGSTAEGSIQAAAVSGGMSFNDGTAEAAVTLELAKVFRDRLLEEGYDVLMLRDDTDVQLDNVARTVIANNTADCMISIHWDGDDLDHDKGCFYISVPDGLKSMEPVSSYWKEHERLGQALVDGLRDKGCKIYDSGSMDIDLTQTSYSTVPSVDIEMGNQASVHDGPTLEKLAAGLVLGVDSFFGSEG